MLLGLSFAWQIILVFWRQMGFLWAIKYFPFMFCLDHDLYGKSILICSYFTETIIFISELPVIIRKRISCTSQYYFYIAINLHWFFWQKTYFYTVIFQWLKNMKIDIDFIIKVINKTFFWILPLMMLKWKSPSIITDFYKSNLTIMLTRPIFFNDVRIANNYSKIQCILAGHSCISSQYTIFNLLSHFGTSWSLNLWLLTWYFCVVYWVIWEWNTLLKGPLT